MTRTLLTTGLATFALALGGCGGDDEDKPPSSGGTSKTADNGDAQSLDTVLDCLKVGGLDAKDQSNSGGEVIGIDYPAGRLVISFKESAEDAETYASVAEANGYTAFVKGTLAITIPADPAAESARPAVEECVS
jgi:hypothetical protein